MAEFIRDGIVVETAYIERLDRTVFFIHDPDSRDGFVECFFVWGAFGASNTQTILDYKIKAYKKDR